MPHILTGPFSFTYGAEALIPVEIVEASPRVSFYNADLNREALGVAKHLLDEHRNDVSIRNACYKQRMARYHNRRVKEQIFQVGDSLFVGPVWFTLVFLKTKSTSAIRVLGMICFS